jgi:hypothetical protein
MNEIDTQDLSPYSLRMRLTADPPSEADQPEGGSGEEQRERVDRMQWVGLPEVSGGNQVPLGRWTGKFDYNRPANF